MKRHLVFLMDFDTRSLLLEEPGDAWDEQPRKLHIENRKRLLEQLKIELGPLNFDSKLQNFKDVGFAPFSIVSYHNAPYHQIRHAFVHGYYYPSLVGSCALGERILNHLIIDLREHFKSTPEYKKIYRKESFDDWGKAISLLQTWNIFQLDSVADNFQTLETLRNRSVHFNPETYKSLRADTLSALRILGEIISKQFGFSGGQDWVIPGTRGAFFIKIDYQTNPFIRHYYLPQCPLVGPYYSVDFLSDRTVFFDREEYENMVIEVVLENRTGC